MFSENDRSDWKQHGIRIDYHLTRRDARDDSQGTRIDVYTILINAIEEKKTDNIKYKENIDSA